MIIEINPLDTLFFRDGKPFTMGEETWSNSIFPPPPSVIYGALRSAYFANHIDDLEKANEEDDPTKGLKIKGIYLKISNEIKISDEIFFPLPMDCVKKKDGKEGEGFMLLPALAEGFVSNYPKLDKILIGSDNKVENIQNGIFSKLDFEEYLNRKTADNIYYLKIDNCLMNEPKIGIALSSQTHSSQEGMLYRVDMKRLENKRGEKISIVIDFDGPNLPEKGMMKLGGEGKTIKYNKYEKLINIGFPQFEENTKQFKIVLTTPAIFEKGWLPEWINEKTLIGEFNGLKMKLLTAAIGKPVHIGGFDMKEKRPKPMFKAVPAGSVYYLELISGNMKEVKNVFHQKAISDFYPEQGFGIAYVGSVKNA